MASLASVAQTNRVSTIERSADASDSSGDLREVAPSSNQEEKSFADWSTYHSAAGGFSVYLPDHREEGRHLRSGNMGLDGPGVQARFVQLPNTSDPIESWPAIGEVWLRAMWIDNSDRDSPPPTALIPSGATSTTVAVGKLRGTEFLFRKGNETQKGRLFVKGNRAVMLTATFAGREVGEDVNVPFGEQADRFLGSLRFESGPVHAAATLISTDTGKSDAPDSFAMVESYVSELTGGELSEHVVRTRVDDLRAAARQARASPDEVLTLLRSAKAEVEARGVSPELAIRAVTVTLGVKSQRKR